MCQRGRTLVDKSIAERLLHRGTMCVDVVRVREAQVDQVIAHLRALTRTRVARIFRARTRRQYKGEHKKAPAHK
ncbi:MAG TPA: hypothetical protein VIV40_27700 [Kofleriaceae bacterium]